MSQHKLVRFTTIMLIGGRENAPYQIDSVRKRRPQVNPSSTAGDPALASAPAGLDRGSMVVAKDAVGAYGERVAARALVDAGMIIVARNWRCSTGEIDIIAIERKTIVFCEVKTRRSGRFGIPAEAINPDKVRRLRALAATWLAVNPDMRGEVRFDLVSVWPQPSGPAVIEHLRGVF